MKPASPAPIETPVVYRWRDGSVAELRLSTSSPEPGPWVHGEGFVELFLRFVTHPVRFFDQTPVQMTGEEVFTIEVSPPGGVRQRPAAYVANRSLHKLKVVPYQKILGFLLDLGVDRFFDHYRGLLATHYGQAKGPSYLSSAGAALLEPSVLLYPRWVSDEAWEKRYEEAAGLVVGELGRTPVEDMTEASTKVFLGWLRGFTLQYETCADRRYRENRTRWHVHLQDGSGRHWKGQALEGTSHRGIPAMVDAVLADEGILPLSAKAEWEATHVERGEFVLPTEDEVNLYRAVGEVLPFFWGYERVREWMLEQVRSS